MFDGERERRLSVLFWEISEMLELEQVSSYQCERERELMGWWWGGAGWVGRLLRGEKDHRGTD